jgi:hypothetical protein
MASKKGNFDRLSSSLHENLKTPIKNKMEINVSVSSNLAALSLYLF